MDKASIKLGAGGGRELLCECGLIQLEPGLNKINLSAKITSAPGKYMPSTIWFDIGKLRLEYETPVNDGRGFVQVNSDDTTLLIQAHMRQIGGLN